MFSHYSLGTTIWCDPIVKREYLKDSALWVSLWYAGLKLLGDVNTGNLASKNPEVNIQYFIMGEIVHYYASP